MESVGPLNYASKPAAAERILRRGYRWVLLIAILAAAVLWAPGAWRWGQYFYWRHRCATFSLPPNHVMYEIAGGKVLHSEAALAEIQFDHLSAKHVYVATIFLHEMRRPGGEPCLLSLELEYVPNLDRGSKYVLQLHDQTWDLFGFPRPPRWENVVFPQIDDFHHWKFFAGQIDPQNPSHLTFDYVLDGQRHTCDGWLDEDGRLVVSRRP